MRTHHHAEETHQPATVVHELFGKNFPDAMAKLLETINQSRITKLECRILGILSKCADKPIKLKRAYNNIWDQTAAHIWQGLHNVCQQVVEQYATKAAAAKKAKVAAAG